MKRLYKNWFVHNVFSHPMSEVVYWAVRPLGKKKAADISGWVHDITIPEHEPGTGRARK
jgi:hypothetical protein